MKSKVLLALVCMVIGAALVLTTGAKSHEPKLENKSSFELIFEDIHSGGAGEIRVCLLFNSETGELWRYVDNDGNGPFSLVPVKYSEE